jgi:hypothetical protein
MTSGGPAKSFAAINAPAQSAKTGAAARHTPEKVAFMVISKKQVGKSAQRSFQETLAA